MRKINSKLNPYKDEIIRLYTEEKISLSEIARRYSCCNDIVRRLLKANDIEIRPFTYYQRKYEINHDFLDEIITQEQAYFLGFFYADGSNNSEGNGFTIDLSSIDKEILGKFNKILNSNYKIRIVPGQKNKNGYTGHEKAILSVTSRKLNKRLTELGAPPVKTSIIKWPNFLRDDLIPHFIRGYFDGDGSFSSKGSTAVKVTIISTKNFLNGLKDYLNNQDIKTGSVNDLDRVANENIGRLDIQAQSSVKAFMDFIYKDATIYLERKHEKYLDYYERGKSICTDKARSKEEYNASRRKKYKENKNK